MRIVVLATLAALAATGAQAQVSQNCVINCMGRPSQATNPYGANSVTNPYSPMGSPYSNTSATNPYATQAPKLVDQNGNYRGNLSANPYDANSTSNPYGRYGSQYSPDSVNNPYAPKVPVYVVPKN